MEAVWERYLEPTPLNHLLLAEMWDSLSQESKVALLECLLGDRGKDFVPEPLVRKAIEEPDAYLRYLAAKSGVWKGNNMPAPKLDDTQATPGEMFAALRLSLGGYDNELEARFRADPSPLVRAAVSAREHRNRMDFSWMLTSTQLERLLFIANEATVSGDTLAEFIRSAIGHISEEQLQEFLSEYAQSRHTKNTYASEETGDAMSDFTNREWFNKVWDLVGTAPHKVFLPLLWYFPTQTMLWEIEPEVIARLDDNLLALILRRRDAELPQLRKRIAASPTDFGPKTQEAADEWPQYRRQEKTDTIGALAARVTELTTKVEEAMQKKRGLFS